MWMKRIVGFCYFVAKRFMSDDCAYRASALTFTSLLAIVPLMSVSLTIFSALPPFKHLIVPIQNFIFAHFIPETGAVLQKYLQGFALQAQRLSFTGLTILFVTTLLTLFTVERTMNVIWRVEVRRRGVRAFLLYWAVLSLGPLLLGLSVAASSYILSLPFLTGTMAHLNINTHWLLSCVSFSLSVLAFSFFYLVIPNCKVPIRYGLCGAIFSSVLFELAKFVFAFYLKRFHTYALLYGAFASIPLFFLWVYWVWLIVFLGAEVTYALTIKYRHHSTRSLDPFTHAIHWLGYLWEAQKQGKGLSLQTLIARDQCHL